MKGRIAIATLLLASLAACHREDPADRNATAAAATAAPAGPVLANGQDLAAVPVDGAPLPGVPTGITAFPGATLVRAERMGEGDWRYVMRTAATPAQVIDHYAATLGAAGFILPSRSRGPAGPAISLQREGTGVSVDTGPAEGGGTDIAIRITAR